MSKLQNVAFQNRVIVVINSIYAIIVFCYGLLENTIAFAFFCSILLINALLYWIISGYKKRKGTKFSFVAKLIIALWFPIVLFGLVFWYLLF
ncbi:hypothetical protein [uncultured Helicobacter sp.]|uniref:hypothetical protein n=1 Tax=uncultured Helicobacter sp. TaxID=175537 RepID=UPI0026153874|nr:hypothetical protein [uncultured Helicobacter sp.]